MGLEGVHDVLVSAPTAKKSPENLKPTVLYQGMVEQRSHRNKPTLYQMEDSDEVFIVVLCNSNCPVGKFFTVPKAVSKAMYYFHAAASSLYVTLALLRVSRSVSMLL
ncbi:hypothetical protein Anapl_05879 [Anas platyrhynchos]|uniref:Uncharacterized protein n=1 Tax=Anas platyrhynchos TaxID=8839 RepID=R0M7C3_ANAPL|nr:hypothetical protein Anapl_05879 [Anas platyrhynchos]